MGVGDRPAISLFVAFALLTLTSLVVAYLFIGEVTAIKGGYVLLGLLLAAVLYRSHEGWDEDAPLEGRESGRFARWSTKFVVVLTLGAYVVTYLTGARLWPVVVALGLGYAVLAVQILSVGPTRSIVPQLAVLFTVSPVTKYLSTGFYFGETDLLGHVRAVEVLYLTGQLESIGEVYASYNSFPVLHILSGAVSSFTGLPAYDSLITVGILTYTAGTIAVYYLCRTLFSRPKSVAIVFVFSTLSVIHNYTTYFFPQALATAVVFFLFYVTIRRNSVSDRYYAPLSVIALLVVVGLAFTHHVTQILFAGMVATLYAPSVLRPTRIGRGLGLNDALPRLVPMLFAVTAGLTHLLVARIAIVGYFIEFTTAKVTDPFVSDTGGERTVFGFGVDIPYHTPRVAVESLFYVDGLYFIGLTALFVVGVVAVIVRYNRYTNVAGVVLLGFGSALAVLKTPLLNTVARLSLPLTLFFSVIAGLGLWRVAVGASGSIGDGVARTTTRRIALFGLVVMLGVTGPLVAGDDLYGLHAGANMWETYSTPEQQVEFSEQELGEIEALTRHSDRYSDDVTMLWVTREASDRFGGEERSEPTDISAGGIRADGALAYRTKWTEHQVGYSTTVPGTLYIADWWLYREIGATNKVYTTGTTGVLWEESVRMSNNRSVA